MPVNNSNMQASGPVQKVCNASSRILTSSASLLQDKRLHKCYDVEQFQPEDRISHTILRHMITDHARKQVQSLSSPASAAALQSALKGTNVHLPQPRLKLC